MSELMEVDNEVIQSDFPSQFTQDKLFESLHHLHESARLAKEIETAEKKLSTLTLMRDNYKDDSQPTPALNTLLKSIDEIERNISNLKSEMNGAEQTVVQGFQDILYKISCSTDNKSNLYTKQMKAELHKFVTGYSTEITNKTKAIDASLTKLKQSKLDVSAEQSLYNDIEQVKRDTVQAVRDSIGSLTQEKETRFTQLQTRMNEHLNKFSPESIAADVQSRIMNSIDAKLATFMKSAQQETLKLMAEEQSVKINGYVEQLVLSHVDKDNLTQIMTGLPEFQNLQRVAEENSNSNEPIESATTPEFTVLKSSLQNMASELVRLKQVIDSTRAIVNTLKEYGIPSPAKQIEFDLAASVKHMEDMNRDMTVMYNSIKVMEAVNSIQSITSRKRKRPEGMDIDNINDEIDARLARIEERHETLQDYVFQYKGTVLHENYPDRINTSMQRIQTILTNHERFIAFLVDPFTKDSSNQLQLQSGKHVRVNDAMLEAIDNLVRRTAEQVAIPLQEKIKSLEAMLE